MNPRPSPDPVVQVEDDRTGTSVATLKQAILDNLYYVAAKTLETATDIDHFTAVAYTVRDRILARWIATLESYAGGEVRIVSLPFGRISDGPSPWANNLLNLGLQRLSGKR